MRRQFSLLLLPLAASCGGGGGAEDDGAPPQTVAISPVPVVTPTPTPTTPTSSPPPTPAVPDFVTRSSALYAVQPDVSNCRPGQHTKDIEDQVLRSLNEIRALHRLPPVAYSVPDEPAALSAALMMVANGKLDHMPPATWLCYSDLGATGARTSNLASTNASTLTSFRSNDQYLADFLTETTNGVADGVGHRRWILDPFLNAVAFGRVAVRLAGTNTADAVALKIIGNPGAPPAPEILPKFVAYPFENYPAKFFDTDAVLSFGVVVDPARRSNNTGVDFSKATVEVRQRGSVALQISRVKYDNDGYGLPNNIQFFAAGLQRGLTYDVAISNVIVGGAPMNYAYYFRIVD
jgi:uncharacterized protein YkwD